MPLTIDGSLTELALALLTLTMKQFLRAPGGAALAFVAIFAAGCFDSFAQSFRFDPPAVRSNGAVDLRLIGPATKAHRIEVSSDLGVWVPLTVLSATNGTKNYRTPPSSTRRFYRAIEQTPGFQIYSIEPSWGFPGTEVVLKGDFTVPATDTDKLVRFGLAVAEVTQATAHEWRVIIPSQAASGHVTALTATTNAVSEDVFTVLGVAPVTVIAPPGMLNQNFTVVNTYGGTFTTNGGPALKVRHDIPMLNAAVDNTTNRFLYAISVGPGPLTLSVESTAQAIVFLHPTLVATETVLGTLTMNLIRTNAKVIELAGLLSPLYAQAGDPFTNAAVRAKYAEAVNSVAATSQMRAYARPSVKGGSAPLMAEVPSGDYPLDLEYTMVLASDEDGGSLGPYGRRMEHWTGPRFPYLNPVDWLVVVQEIDVNAAFPQGRLDFDNVYREKRRLEMFPLKGFTTNSSVSANLVTERFNIVKFGMKSLAQAIQNKLLPSDDTIRFPQRDGVYVLRSIGPGINDTPENDFVYANYREQRLTAIAGNLAAVTMDLVSLLIDLKALEIENDVAETATKTMLEAIKAAPNLHEPADFEKLTIELVKFVLQEISDKLANAGAKALFGKAVKAGAEKTSLVNTVLSGLDKLGGAGQVYQRELGLLVTTPMETALIVIGEPFKLDSMTISPTNQAPGEEVLINFRSSAITRMFDTNITTDGLSFEGPEVFTGEIQEITGTPTNQNLRVKIPTTLGLGSDGTYTVYVNIQGRRGKASFRLTSVASISEIIPTAGFAAVDEFMGAPFTGTPLRVKGVLFASSDKFFFGHETNAPEATTKSGSAGNVQISIPKNATTSQLRVVYKGTNVYGPGLITVWTNPIIHSITPTNGSAGTPVVLSVGGVGTDPNLIRVQFSGADPQYSSVSLNGTIKTAVPGTATSGTIAVITPGGSTSRPFTVLPAPPIASTNGSGISAGVDSQVSVQEAIVFATVGGFPYDDDDDPPQDDGDFINRISLNGEPSTWYLGPAYRNSVGINGTNGGNYNFVGADDSYSGGTLPGSNTVSGNRLLFSNMRFEGPLVVTGRSNSFVNCTFAGTTTVTGIENSIHGTVTGQLILEGDNNRIGFLTAFRYTPSHALIIRGDHNHAERINADTNSGDVVRIEGGQYNYVLFNRSRGNLGNGATLTGGAAFNEVSVSSGDTVGGVVTNGNGGHGIALIGHAHDNWVYGSVTPSLGANGLDGICLDGTNVYRNRIGAGQPVKADHNGRNGITITNGAHDNQVGIINIDGKSYTPVDTFYNKGHGLHLSGGHFTTIGINAGSNGLCGVCISDVKDSPSGTLVMVSTGFSSSRGSTPGNGQAGLRLDRGTTGVRADMTASLRRDTVGFELDDAEANVFEGTINGPLTDGVIVRNARRNELNLRSVNCPGSGMILYNAQGNILKVNEVADNQGDGIRFVGGSDNRLVPGFSSRSSRNRNGIIFEQGARGNSVTDLIIQNNREHGIIIDGAATVKNTFSEMRISNSGMDGVHIRNQASGVTFGTAVDSIFAVRGSSLQNNTNAGVRITGAGTRDITIAGTMIYGQAPGVQTAGVIVENNATNISLTHNTYSKNTNGVIIRDGAKSVSIQKSIIDSNVENGILISNGSDVSIGGADTAFGNTLYSNAVAIKMTGSAVRNCQIQNNPIYDNGQGITLEQRANLNQIGPGNRLDRNVISVAVDFSSTNTITRNTIRSNIIAGVRFTGAASQNLVADNTIRANTIGVSVNGNATIRNSILNNSITDNGGNGIVLTAGGNNEIDPPEFEEVQGNGILGTSTAPDGSRVQIFQDQDTEGETLFTTAQVVNGRFRASIDIEPWKIGLLFNISATVTDPEGNTSPFNSKLPEGDAGEKIVFTSTRDGNSEIYMLAPPSATPINLTRHTSTDNSASLAGGGSNCNQVVFVSNRSGNREIFVVEAVANATSRQLTTNTVDDYDPDWLEDCVKIVFVSERDGNAEIYKMEADGSGVVRLTDNSAIERNPSRSVDGTKILFESNRGGQFGLWIMNVDGSSPQPFLASPLGETQPVMSPDGNYVAFVSERDGNPEIYVVQSNGSGLQRLTANSVADRDPAWAPDSSSIIFASDRVGGAELFTIPRIGGIAQPMLLGAGNNTQPSLAKE